MLSNHAAWKLQLDAKVAHLRELVRAYLTNKQEEVAREIDAEIAGLKTCFSKNQLPGPIGQLEGALRQLREQKNNPGLFEAAMNAYQVLPSIASFSDAAPPSFDEIFDAYKADGELQALVDELVGLLQRVLDEGEDELTVHMAREIQGILGQLRKWNLHSLYELTTWLDFTARAAILIIQAKTGLQGGDLIYDVLKTATRVRKKVKDSYENSRKQLMAEHKLTLVAKSVERMPELPSEEEVQKLIGGPPQQPSNKS